MRISTGLCDSQGVEVFVGDQLKRPVECNQEFHGDWAIYEVRQQGLTPIIAYIRSEKGQLLPEGYLATPLCELYDGKMFAFAKDSLTVQPEEDIRVVTDKQEVPGDE